MASKTNIDLLTEGSIRSVDTDDLKLTEKDKRKVLLQRQISDLRDQKERLESFNKKIELSDLDISLMVDIYSNLCSVEEVLDDMAGDLSELESDVQDATIDVQNYIVKHRRCIEGDESPESSHQSPYMAFTSVRMSLGSLTHHSKRSSVWIQ